MRFLGAADESWEDGFCASDGAFAASCIYGEEVKKLAKRPVAENKLNNGQLTEIKTVID
ncbi:MAG: hypothetical protein ACK5O1_05655 [Holosporales bacterium]